MQQALRAPRTSSRHVLTARALRAVACAVWLGGMAGAGWAADAAAAVSTSSMPWWGWALALFVVCFVMGILAVPQLLRLGLGNLAVVAAVGVAGRHVVDRLRKMVIVVLLLAGTRAVLKGLGVWP